MNLTDLEPDLVGKLAFSSSIALILFGLVAQIRKNYKLKDCQGLSFMMLFLSLICFSLWAWYGWVKPDNNLKFSQTPGAVLSLVLVLQWIYYCKIRPSYRRWRGEGAPLTK